MTLLSQASPLLIRTDFSKQQYVPLSKYPQSRHDCRMPQTQAVIITSN